MLVVTIDIHPYGWEKDKRTLSKVVISNNGGNTDPDGLHTYNVELVEADNSRTLIQTQIVFRRDRGHLALVREALLELEITE